MSGDTKPHTFPVTSRNKIKRLPERGHYDRDTIYRIIDEALICHIAFIQDNQPFIIPTLHARDRDQLLLHGAATSRLLKHVAEGHPLSISMTLVDGLVLAKSAFHHSVNYRSVVIFGRGRILESDAERIRGLELFTERMIMGRWPAVRPPNVSELKATVVVSIPIDVASAKIRSGLPKDDEADLDLPIWSGVIPLRQVALAPISAEQRDIPAHVSDFVLQRSGE